MYESPKLNRIGDAQDVILGYIATGTDLDTTFCENSMEYADRVKVSRTTFPAPKLDFIHF